MTASDSGAPAPDVVTGAHWRERLRALLPYLGTAATAVAISLALEYTLFAPQIEQPVATALALPPTLAPTSPPAATPTAAPTSPPLTESISRQELADLRVEVDRLWTVVYLSRAISQVADAETALRSNDRQGVDQSLIAVDDSLALAYGRADTPSKDPIREIRRQVGDIRDDLYLRPEAMDVRFARLRQSMLALVESRPQ